jgi:hypothetical protein
MEKVSKTYSACKFVLKALFTEQNKHVEGLFHQYFEWLVKDIQIVVSVVCDNRRINV